MHFIIEQFGECLLCVFFLAEVTESIPIAYGFIKISEKSYSLNLVSIFGAKLESILPSEHTVLM